MDLLKENQQWAKAASELAEKVMEQNSQIKKMRDVLRRLRAWDMMDATSDGEYWKKEITIALRADEESAPTNEETREMAVKMAKASKEDIHRVRMFFQFIEEFMEYGTHTPYNKEVEEESIELDDAKFVEMLRAMWGGRFKPVGVDCMWSRVVFGCDMLIDNCCDPNSDVLEWKPEIVELLHEAAVNKLVEEQ